MWSTFYSYSTTTLDPSLCTISKENALVLISKALENIALKIKEFDEKELKEVEERKKKISLEAEEAWNVVINNVVDKRNGISGSFFKRLYRKLLIFLHISEFSTFTEVVKEIENSKRPKSCWIKSFKSQLVGYGWECRGNRGLLEDRSRLEDIKKAAEMSDSISLSIKDSKTISRYTEDK